MRGIHYREWPPPAELADSLRRVWAFRGTFAEPHDERIVPDGSPELIFHFGDPYLEPGGARGRWLRQARVLLAGNLTRPLVLRAWGSAGVLGLRLWPHAVGRFTDLPTVQTVDGRWPLHAATRRRAISLLRRAPRARLFAEEGEPAAAMTAHDLARRLAALLARPAWVPDARVAWAVAELFRRRGQVSAEGLARDLALSRRQLERLMVAATGLSPKRLASIVRFRAVFDELQAGAPTPWLQAALAAGFFDQAHMIRAFRRFAGRPPRAYLETAGMLSRALVAAR